MPTNSVCALQPSPQSYQYMEVQTNQGNKRLIYDNTYKLTYQLNETRNTAEPALKPITQTELQNLKITFIDKIITCTPAAMLKEPSLFNTILGQFNTSSSIPNRFQAIMNLSQTERLNYKQLSNLEQTETLRCNLIALIDEDLKAEFLPMLKEWETFGVSASEVDLPAYTNFEAFYDETMESHSIVKEDYSKVDFSSQNIKPKITDARCLNAKLTPLQLFKAAFQLGDIPAVSNFRFMDNPASKDDGKYREWMFHLDNSNYAAEFKIITTRKTGTLDANKEQYLAAFPYDTKQSIRFTRSEAATKFPTLESLENEFHDVPGARYVVIKNPHNDVPIEAGIRTEMIAHHRSASNKNGLDHGESRSAELMTFHGVDRCQPFLSHQELAQAVNLTPLQNFVLGGFKNSAPEKFIEHMADQKPFLNSQIRKLIEENGIKPLESITVAKFSSSGIEVTDASLFKKQIDTYDSLPEVIEKIPRLIQGGDVLKKTVIEMVPMLMNYDQNAELKPDCSENKAFPARTQLRERTNEAFGEPLTRDLEKIEFTIDPRRLLPMDEIIGIAKSLTEFYTQHNSKLKDVQPNNRLLSLFESRAELAYEYVSQLPLRATHPETHQTICLFLYYMIDDLGTTHQTFLDNGVTVDETRLNTIKEQKLRLFQHFITARLMNDSLSN
ncbi:hypothetical protein AEQ67_22390 [Pseudomonas sp. RIT-PI-q]|uniref:hypothetical protein n=1 Tax=Pseudomonas sp. RIT-PI-q TaxID=1690247 RepID=UPI0006CC5A8E|nr:hypothetical protein [Pseudomonas sp. RIT-PI-q]KPG94895.1 hypothetical protein AEQ67_22390 [Pseudomonas sp. RIT-PI-q]